MLKSRKAGFIILFLTLTMIMSGCGLFPGEQALTEIDPPKDVDYMDEGETLNEDGTLKEDTEKASSEEEQSVDTVERELYLIDENGYVVPQTLKLPHTKEVAKQALEYLVKNGPVENVLPNGFRGVLPADTQVLGVNLKEDTVIADFSKEFKNYKPEEEMKILQAITWTLTQFDNVSKVKIRINGYDQKEMPVNGTPITEGMSRANGINVDTSSAVNVTNSKAVTLYYLAQNEDNTYYVPVTKRIDDTKAADKIAAAVKELINGPSFSSGLLTDFNSNVKMLKEPVYKNGIVTLDFNEAILGEKQGSAVSEHVLNSLVLSLTEQQGVEGVSITVNGKAEVANSSGEKLTKPVMRPQKVNTASF